jgi:PBP1b-binding outer membrane lipoprotein LpoB|tara:strand:- start:217 stop:417 length:201 start_codon:yes stop_codon:yes gene_type:complete
MTKTIISIIVLAFLVGCSAIPENPRVSFGKKCSTTVENQVAYSYVWLYNKESGLEADKQTCEKLEN